MESRHSAHPWFYRKEDTMSVEWTTLERKIRELPPDLQQEVEEFVDRLTKRRAETRQGRPKPEPTFRWAGALKDEKKTSVELQHEIVAQWNAKT
jgi:hypothetical protein